MKSNVFTQLCQQIYETGKWPTNIPLEKKLNAMECSDFRTISLLGHAAKRFSTVMITNVLPPFYGSQCIETNRQTETDGEHRSTCLCL